MARATEIDDAMRDLSRELLTEDPRFRTFASAVFRRMTKGQGLRAPNLEQALPLQDESGESLPSLRAGM